ncbi:MAG: Flp pilus assembly protein CpaB [Planctomycetaceae bacterium]|nr:Flp pilus assembly protein CpaB [Planctomycetaceae bacterium]
MRPKTLALLAVAALCGLVAMMGVQQVLSNQGGEKTESGQVMVAIAEILPGQPLDETNVEFRSFPGGTIPEGAISSKEQLQERTLKVRTFPGSQILQAMLDKKGARSASSEVRDGMSVVSVPIDQTMTGVGLIHPGDNVDVLVTYRPVGSREVNGVGKEVKTVLEYVEVFSIDGVRDANLLPKPGDPKAVPMKTVQLQVTGEQARLLKLAGDVGTIYLTLRAMNDKHRIEDKELFDPKYAEHVNSKSEDERDLPRPVAEVKPVPQVNVDPKSGRKKWQIEIIAGAERRIEEVDLPEEEPVTLNTTSGS